MHKIFDWLKRAIRFLTTDIWHISSHELPGRQAFLLRQVKIIAISIKGFSEEKIQMRASALTFYTLLSVVPVMAMVFGIAKGFGIERRFETVLMNRLHGHEAVVNWIIEFANKMLENSKGGLVAGIGLLILFWAVMSVLGNIEGAMNSIWQIRKSRPFVRKFADYTAVMLIAPVFIFLISSVNILITSQLQNLSELYPILEKLKFLLKMSPYLLVWILFAVIIIAMPNTKVKFRYALIGGIIAGTLFQLVQWGYIHFQVGVSRYNAIYGSFAALPLFMIWLQVSWLIVLLGAQITFANQNVNKYELDYNLLNLSTKKKQLLSLMVARLVIINFATGKTPFTASQISGTLEIPIRLVRETIHNLVEARLLSELSSDNPKERAYQPAMDINQLSVSRVLDRLDSVGEFDFGKTSDPAASKISRILEAFRSTVEHAPQNKRLMDI